MKIERIHLAYDEYKIMQAFAKERAMALMKHEDKNYAKVSFPHGNYRKIKIEDQVYYYGGTNIFLHVTEEVILDARRSYPKNFGSGNAMTIIHALNKTSYLSDRIKDAARIYGNENFIWVYDSLEAGNDRKVLRLDLYRMLKPIPRHRRKYDFVGGLFHVLKHFSSEGMPLGTGTDINNVLNVEHVIFLLIHAFFSGTGTLSEDGKTYKVNLPLNDIYCLRCIFYYEPITNVYFLTTAHKVKNKPKKNREQLGAQL